MATIILIKSYSARKESKDVMVPAPGIIGKASGTMEATSGASTLNKEIPKIISKAKKKITKEPATTKRIDIYPDKVQYLLS